MIKVLHIGDLHLGGSYPEKAEKSINFLIEQLESQSSPAYRPDLVVCTGDTTEKPLHVHSEDLRPLLKLIRQVQVPMIFLQGTPSHEPYGFLKNLEEAGRMVINVLDRPTVTVGPLNGWACNGIASEKQIAIAALPAINKPILYKWAGELGLPQGEPDDIIRSILIRFSEQWADFKGPKILLGHWTVNGCQTASGQTLYGSDMSIGLDDLALAGADAILLGHIHKVQSWGGDGGATPFITYCGSSYPVNWGELDPKSFNVIPLSETGGFEDNIERVKYPHKPMVKIDVEFTGKQVDGVWEWVPTTEFEVCSTIDVHSKEIIQGSEVKVCYSVPKEIAAQVDDMYVRVMFRRIGIDLAAVERKILSTDRQRISDIGSKETTRDQYLAVCNAKGEEPRAGALAKCDVIDEKAVAL